MRLLKVLPIVLLLLLAGCGEKNRTVVLAVDGNPGQIVDVRYDIGTGMEFVPNATLPWSKTVEGVAGKMILLSSIARTVGPKPLTASISIDGKVVKQGSGPGRATIDLQP